MKNAKGMVLSAAVAALALAVVLLLHSGDALRWLENKAYDSRMKATTGFFQPSEDIAVVLLDQHSLQWAEKELGWSYPWPRESYAKMIKFFNRGNAASMAFDMVYTEPSFYGPEDDKILGDESRDFGRVVQTVFYQSNKDEVGILPVEPIREGAAKIATVQSLLDSDGVARRARFHSSSKERQPSLTVASLELSDEMPDENEIPKARHGKEGESETGMYVRFMSSLNDYIPYSAELILRSELAIEEAEKNGEEYDAGEDLLDPEMFDGMHIFFGLFAPGLFDICATPISASYPGVGVHIAQMDTILQQEYLSDVPDWAAAAMIVVGVMLGSLLALVQSQRQRFFVVRLVLFLLVLSAYFAATYSLFIKGIILPVSTPMLGFILGFAGEITKSYLTEGRQKRYLKTAFKQYLSPAVIDNLIENPSALKLGGEEREITAYFSDVQGFTSISEKLNPTELTNLLNKYLNAMTEIIFKHGGTIDKYEGDAIIAFWNAPTTQEDHARRAVEAAMECQQKLVEMQDELVAVTGKPFVQRIGLNSGKAVVGNMGSDFRFDYTMLGDTVNLASRLEGINKQFGTYTMCSKATMESAVEHGCTLSFRKVSNIAVVGKKEGVVVFEPMTNAEYDRRKDDFVNYGVGYDLFVKGNFEEAIKAFEKTRAKDPAADKFIEKCRALIKNPPEKWDGILRATEK